MRNRQRIAAVLLALAICLLVVSPALAKLNWSNPLSYSMTDKIPDEITAIVEIPTGSIVKYEADAATGLIVANRFQSMPVTYPANYGSLTQTIGGDGDPLDVLILTREPLVSGAAITVRPIGVLMMTDGGDPDEKIIAVPVSGVDPTYDSITTAADLPAIELARISQFFTVYKQLPGNKVVDVTGIQEVAPAKALVKDAFTRYQAATDRPGTTWVHPFDFPQADNAPAELNVVIEIPAGSFIKYELDADNGNLIADRFQSMPVAYPANYGSITRSEGGDGDPLDVLVLTREPLQPGTIVTVRPIGYLKMVDSGEADEKVLAVPTSDVDPTYDAITDLADMPAMELKRIEAFFRIYKQLPKPKVVEVTGFATAAEAKTLVGDALARYTADAANVKRTWVSPLDYPETDNYPAEVYAVIEIPAGSFTKYEYDAASGRLVADRFQSMAVQYPANYGSIVQSKGGDGDPLDVLVFSRAPLAPGAVVLVRPIGVLNMVDGGEADEKIVAVPAESADPTYNDVATIADLPAIEGQRVESFFQTYKLLPTSRKSVVTKGFQDATAARNVVKDAVDAYHLGAGAGIKTTLNGQPVDLGAIADGDAYPLVPLRAFSEKLGVRVTWNAIDRSVTVTNGAKTFTVRIGATELVDDGVTTSLSAPVLLMNSRTMMDLNDLATALGVSVQWDAAARSITIH